MEKGGGAKMNGGDGKMNNGNKRSLLSGELLPPTGLTIVVRKRKRKKIVVANTPTLRGARAMGGTFILN